MTTPMPPVCVLAGGLGTRLGERVREIPKPLLQVAGRPFLCHQLELLARYRVTSVVMCVSYLGELIVEQIGSERYGISIAYSFDAPERPGTLAAIVQARPLLAERFLVLYGDTYLRIDYAAAAAAWEASRLPAMMSVLRNDGHWDRSNADFDGRLVTEYDKISPKPSMRWIDYGLGGLTDGALVLIESGERELASLYSRLSSRAQLFGYEASERFYEIGTPAALRETDAFLSASRRH